MYLNEEISLQTNVIVLFIYLFFCSLDLVCAIGGRQRVCIPRDYQKYDLPHPTKPTFVTIGVDIKALTLTILSAVLLFLNKYEFRPLRRIVMFSWQDIPKVSDKDFSITLNAYFNVKWRDPRLIVSKDYSKEGPPPQVTTVSPFLSHSHCCFCRASSNWNWP